VIPGDTKTAIDALTARAREIRKELARRDPNVFNEMVLLDEQTGEPVKQASHHVEMQLGITKHRKLVIMSHVESGKTQQLIGRILWELGHNLKLRICIISYTGVVAHRIAATVAKYIEHSSALHEIFPKLRKGAPWSAEKGYCIKGHGIAKEPSVWALGQHGNVLSARIDWACVDDLLTEEGTYNDHRRQDTINWWDNTIYGRLTKNARVTYNCNAWHEKDHSAVLEKKARSKLIKIGVRGPNGKSRWSEVWPEWRIEEFEEDNPQADRLLHCVRSKMGSSRFTQDGFELCKARGKGVPMFYRLRDLPEGYRIATGIDLAFTKNKKSARTVFFTILEHPDGSRQLAFVEGGKWNATETLKLIPETFKRYRGIQFVEGVGAQRWMAELTKGVPIKAFMTTGDKKRHKKFGVETLAHELNQGRWIIPCSDTETDDDGYPVVTEPEIQTWIDECMAYDPDPKIHDGDSLMASWFAREALRIGIHHRVDVVLSPEAQAVEDALQGKKDEKHVGEVVQGEALWSDIRGMLD